MDPLSMSRALWLDTGPLRQGWGRGSLPVLLRPDSQLQPHLESSLCGAVGVSEVNLADRAGWNGPLAASRVGRGRLSAPQIEEEAGKAEERTLFLASAPFPIPDGEAAWLWRKRVLGGAALGALPDTRLLSSQATFSEDWQVGSRGQAASLQQSPCQDDWTLLFLALPLLPVPEPWLPRWAVAHTHQRSTHLDV